MGDTVNLASRLEGLNKEYTTHIVVSETTYRSAVNSQLIFRELDLIRVKGKLQPVTIYELLGARNDGKWRLGRAGRVRHAVCERASGLSTAPLGLKLWPSSTNYSIAGPATAPPAFTKFAARNI